ncbi:MAG: RHS repeat-associated core domain-containing protein, partial [Verrucomicrobiales bacterium]
GYRHYDPRFGRWLSRDPLGEAGGFNLYAYCGNDPVNRHDPLGLKDFTGPDGRLDPSLAHGFLEIMDMVSTDFPAQVFGSLWCLPGQVNQGMVQAGRDIDARTESGEWGVGTAAMARGLQFMARASAGVTMAPLQPVNTAVGIVTAPVVLPYNLGTSIGNFGVYPSLSGGFDVFENGLNVAAMIEGGFALQNRFPALQNMRVPPINAVNPALQNVKVPSVRQMTMLQRNLGYNISPEGWFSTYPALGRSGSYLTDYRAVGEILGPVRSNRSFSVGLCSGQNQISYLRAWRLERALGLDRGSLWSGFRFTRVPSIRDLAPRSPLIGNKYFLGPGRGLPGGGPEMVIDPIPTAPWP